MPSHANAEMTPAPEKQQSRADKLIREIGVFDSDNLPRDYKSPEGATTRGVFIRGGQGSTWLNRLSTLVFVVVLAILAAVVVAVVRISTGLSDHTKTTQAAQAEKTAITCEADPAHKSPVIGEAGNIARGATKLAPGIGSTSTQGSEKAQVVPIPGLGKLIVNTAAATGGGVIRVATEFAKPVTACVALAQAGVTEKGPARISLGTALTDDRELSKWKITIVGNETAATGVILSLK